MLGSIMKVLALVLVLWVAGFSGVFCFAGDTTKPAAKELEGLWRDLVEGEPVATRAVLTMAKTPEETTVFLAGRVRPLTLSKERLEALLVQLGSEEKEQWQAAYQELAYFDPRLTMGLEELMGLKAVKGHPARHRLVDVLSDRPLNWEFSAVNMYQVINLRPVGDGGYNFTGISKQYPTGVSWWAEHKVEQLNGGNIAKTKREWTRVVRALALLESFGTEEAVAVIDAVAGGHPEAQPTKVANEMLARLTNR